MARPQSMYHVGDSFGHWANGWHHGGTASQFLDQTLRISVDFTCFWCCYGSQK